MQVRSPIFEDLKAGKIGILIDDAGQSVCGCLFCPAQKITTDQVSFLVNVGRGVTCIALPEERIRELGLPLMTVPTDSASPGFTVSVEARTGVTTGISAADRAQTLRTIANTLDAKQDLVMPGHIFPVRSKTGGVLVRNTFSEAIVDILKLAGVLPAGAFCHCLNAEGNLCNEKELLELADKHGLSLARLSDVIHLRLINETIVEKIADSSLPMKNAGLFRAVALRSVNDDTVHLALIKGEINLLDGDNNQVPILVRVQAQDSLGDLLGGTKFPSRHAMELALEKINHEGRGVFVYIRHANERNIADKNITFGISEQKTNRSTQMRQLGVGAQILSLLGVRKIRLLTDSPRELPGLLPFAIEIVERVRLGITPESDKYY